MEKISDTDSALEAEYYRPTVWAILFCCIFTATVALTLVAAFMN